MHFTWILMILLAVYFGVTFIKVVRLRKTALNELAEYNGLSLTTNSGVEGTFRDYHIKVSHKEAFLSKVFGGTTLFEIHFPHHLPLPFRITKKSLVASINEKFADTEITLGSTFQTGRVRIESDNPQRARAFFEDAPLLKELRGLMTIVEDNVEITEERIFFELPGQHYSSEALMQVLSDSSDLAALMAKRG